MTPVAAGATKNPVLAGFCFMGERLKSAGKGRCRAALAGCRGREGEPMPSLTTQRRSRRSLDEGGWSVVRSGGAAWYASETVYGYSILRTTAWSGCSGG